MTLSEDARILWQTAQTLALKSQAVSPQPRPLPPLLFFTDPERTPDPAATARGLPPGSAVVYRHFGAEKSDDIARDLRQITKASGLLLLIGLDADMARAVEADGVHLPERALAHAPGLRAQNPHWVLTGAVHQVESLTLAKGLDACVVSPVFPAGGHSAIRSDLGLVQFTKICHQAPCPVYGLGGITPQRAPLLLDTGACGIAGVDAFQSAFSQVEGLRT